MLQQIRIVIGASLFVVVVILTVVLFFLLDPVHFDLGEIPLVSLTMVGAGFIGALLLSQMVNRPLPRGTAPQLVNAYRTRALIGMTAAELPVLLGFVASFLSHSVLFQFVGIALCFSILTRVWPSATHAKHLARENDPLTIAELGSILEPPRHAI